MTQPLGRTCARGAACPPGVVEPRPAARLGVREPVKEEMPELAPVGERGRPGERACPSATRSRPYASRARAASTSRPVEVSQGAGRGRTPLPRCRSRSSAGSEPAQLVSTRPRLGLGQDDVPGDGPARWTCSPRRRLVPADRVDDDEVSLEPVKPGAPHRAHALDGNAGVVGQDEMLVGRREDPCPGAQAARNGRAGTASYSSDAGRGPGERSVAPARKQEQTRASPAGREPGRFRPGRRRERPRSAREWSGAGRAPLP